MAEASSLLETPECHSEQLWLGSRNQRGLSSFTDMQSGNASRSNLEQMCVPVSWERAGRHAKLPSLAEMESGTSGPCSCCFSADLVTASSCLICIHRFCGALENKGLLPLASDALESKQWGLATPFCSLELIPKDGHLLGVTP